MKLISIDGKRKVIEQETIEAFFRNDFKKVGFLLSRLRPKGQLIIVRSAREDEPPPGGPRLL